MIDALILFAGVVAMPILVGWLIGRKDVDPNTPKGRAYYARKADQ